MPTSHGTIRFSSIPIGITLAESVADGVVHGDVLAHRASAVSSRTDGAKAGDSVIATVAGVLPNPPSGLTVT